MSNTLTTQQVGETVQRVLKEQLCYADTAPDYAQEASLVDKLNLDSLDHVEIAMALEDELDIEISDDEIEQASTVGGLIDVCKKVLEKGGRLV